MKRSVVAIVLLFALIVVGSASAQDAGAQLRSAVFAGNTAEVKRLAASKATVNSANNEGVTPLMIAAAVGNTEIAALLLTAGADANAKTKTQLATPLMFAADFGSLEIAALLLGKSADPQALDKDGYSAVDYSVISNTGETEADGERVLAVGMYLSEKGSPMTIKSDNPERLQLAVATPDRLKELIDRARRQPS